MKYPLFHKNDFEAFVRIFLAGSEEKACIYSCVFFQQHVSIRKRKIDELRKINDSIEPLGQILKGRE